MPMSVLAFVETQISRMKPSTVSRWDELRYCRLNRYPLGSVPVSNFFSAGNPNTAAFHGLPPGPHSGVDTDPDAHVASGSIDGRARNALTLGLLSLILGVLTGVPAIWVGRKALVHINAANGTLRGRWAAWTGIVLGCLGVAITIGVWMYLHQH
jgi:hypothetical protein